MTYEQVCSYIEEIPKFTKKNGLDHTKTFLTYLNNPQEAFRVIHVAGSNGKGSVCKAISQILVKSGYKTGLFTSPHLIRMEERFCINNVECSKEMFMDSFLQVQCAIQKMLEKGLAHPSFFEILFAMGMLIFQKEKVDIVVLETGLGGRLDATNIVEKPLFTIITSISLEHTEILGDTIEKIAAEKAGIIKEGIPVFVDGTNGTAAEVIRAKATKMHAKCYVLEPNSYKILKNTGKHIDFSLCCRYDNCVQLQIPFVADYQVANLALAYFSLYHMKDILKIEEKVMISELTNICWPGRMQEVLPEVYFDGAHNVSGITEFLKTVRNIGGREPILMFSMVKDKDYKQAISILAKESWSSIILTKIMDKRGLDITELKKEFIEKEKDVLVIDNCREAFHKALALKQTGQKLFCTGSLYFIGELEDITGGMNHDRF